MRREPRLEHGRGRVGGRSRVVTGREGERVARPPADHAIVSVCRLQRVAASRPGGVCGNAVVAGGLRARYETQNRAGATQARATVRGCRTDAKKTIGEKSRATAPKATNRRSRAWAWYAPARRAPATRVRRDRSGGGHGVGHDSRHVSSVRARVVHVTLTWIRLRKTEGAVNGQLGRSSVHRDIWQMASAVEIWKSGFDGALWCPLMRNKNHINAK